MTWGKIRLKIGQRKMRKEQHLSPKKERGGPASCKLSCNAKNKQDTELNVPVGP